MLQFDWRFGGCLCEENDSEKSLVFLKTGRHLCGGDKATVRFCTVCLRVGLCHVLAGEKIPRPSRAQWKCNELRETTLSLCRPSTLFISSGIVAFVVGQESVSIYELLFFSYPLIYELRLHQTEDSLTNTATKFDQLQL